MKNSGDSAKIPGLVPICLTHLADSNDKRYEEGFGQEDKLLKKFMKMWAFFPGVCMWWIKIA